ncbi:MAG: molybdenum cofactor guanylyltransferase [Hyphomicrobiales bacterium]|nr:molybdenum cofactor guanylyltransferase [Hyphomicrobiales bacterium]
MGRDKAWLDAGGEPLVARAVRRLAPQVASVAISVRAVTREFEALGVPLVVDARSEAGAGPLAAVAAGLRYAQAHGFPAIVTVPCDAPFFPDDLVATLAAAAAAVAVARSARGLEPAFGVWRLAAAPAIERALERPGVALRAAFEGAGGAEVAFAPGDPDPFLNLNSPEDAAAFAAALRACAEDGRNAS